MNKNGQQIEFYILKRIWNICDLSKLLDYKGIATNNYYYYLCANSLLVLIGSSLLFNCGIT